MRIDADVQRIAHTYRVDPALIQAVIDAEGGGDKIIRAVQCSEPSVTTREEAIAITCKSAIHALSDFCRQPYQRASAFVAFFGARWAPRGVANDPTDLNANWVGNVLKRWRNLIETKRP